jgi:hypothetical protein
MLPLATRTARFVALTGVFLILGTGRVFADALSVTWDPSSDTRVTGYVVYVGTQSGTHAQLHDVGNTTWFTLSNAVAGQRYFFAVAAYIDGPIIGPKSPEVSGYSNAPPMLSHPGDQTSTVGTYVTLQLVGSDPYGDPLQYAAGGLPPGLVLTPGTGFIAGTPSVAGQYSVLATVSDGVLSDSKSFTWTAVAPPSSTPTPEPTPDPDPTPAPAPEPTPAPDPDPSPAPAPEPSPSPAPTPSLTPPTLAITVPTTASAFASRDRHVVIGGYATSGSGITQVTWSNSRGGSGRASGTDNWIANVMLKPGQNTITITAHDRSGLTARATVTVHKR